MAAILYIKYVHLKNGIFANSDQKNCAVINHDSGRIGKWDARNCYEKHCHVCAQGYGTLSHKDFADEESGIGEFGVGDDSDAVFLDY